MKPRTRAWAYIVLGSSLLMLILGCAALDHFFGLDAAAGGAGGPSALSQIPGNAPAAAVITALETGSAIFGPGSAAAAGLISAIGAAYVAMRKSKQIANAGDVAHATNEQRIADSQERIVDLEARLAKLEAPKNA